jgi:hypothetical protein
MTPLEIVMVAFTAWVTVSAAMYLRSGDWREDYRWLRVLKRGGLAWKAVLVAPLILIVTMAVGLWLMQVGGSVLRFTWLQLLAVPGEQVEGQNLMTAGLRIPWFVYLFLPLLMLNVPRFARAEEEMFRDGVRGWKAGVWSCLKFGLMHCIVGIPVAFGLALAIPGAWFLAHYWKGGLRRSTAVHAVYNWVILLMAAIYLILLPLLGSSGRN